MAIQAQMYPDSSGLALFGVPEWGGGGAVGLHDEMCLNMQRQQMMVARQMHQLQSQFPQPRNTQFLNQSLGGKNVDDAGMLPFSQSLVEKQRVEIDQYILSQSERLRVLLREQRKRDLADMLKKVEARTSAALKQKDEEIAKAAHRALQLESLVIKLQNENQMWQQLARQNELQIINLTHTIEQLQEAAAFHEGGVGEFYNNAAVVEDTESCCGENAAGAPAEQEQQGGLKMVCSICQTRELGVVFLPCRHLCSCTVCDPMIDSCPVCQTEKKASIEALFH
uniref:RING-type domain-containing protein n=1 Tax=Kalanchoe fedtschenkoi TaxID=63787 RepID=A0A7N0U5P0_KALFE